MPWFKHTASNGHYCIENNDVSFSNSTILERELDRVFGERISPSGSTDIINIVAEEFIGEIFIDHVLLLKGYDVWSGVYLLANDYEGDSLIDEFEKALGSTK